LAGVLLSRKADVMDEEAIELALPGDGPFLLPICGSVGLGFGDEIAVLEFRTTDGRAVRIPLPRTVIPALHDLTKEAMAVLAGNAPTLQ
jgi:hypothetical protein